MKTDARELSCFILHPSSFILSYIRLQLVPQRKPGTKQSALQRSQRQAQHVGHLLVIEAFDVAHDEHRTILRVEPAERRQHGGVALAALGLLGRSRRRAVSDALRQRRGLLIALTSAAIVLLVTA